MSTIQCSKLKARLSLLCPAFAATGPTTLITIGQPERIHVEESVDGSGSAFFYFVFYLLLTKLGAKKVLSLCPKQ